jgi:1-deoxy-D-xylulose-5-phosphate synthase
LLQTAYDYPGPALVRYPRGNGPGVEVGAPVPTGLAIGEGEIRRTGSRVAILAFGSLLATGQRVAEHIDATLANMRFIKPLDEKLIDQLAATHQILVTLEENVVMGGAGSGVNEYLVSCGRQIRVLNLGLPDRYLDHASHQEQLAEAGLDFDGILAAIQRVDREMKLQVV